MEDNGGAYVQAWVWTEARTHHPTDADYRKWAIEERYQDGDTEIDQCAIVSRDDGELCDLCHLRVAEGEDGTCQGHESIAS